MLPGHPPPDAVAVLRRDLRPGHRHLLRQLILTFGLLACGRREPFTPPASLPAPWGCAGDTCAQRSPDLPDDGQWDCADVDGIVVCRGGFPPAGVVPGPPATGWACGERRGAAGERICVDESPDLPPPAMVGDWSCHYTHSPERRVCKRGAAPRRPAVGKGSPDCWLDGDCGGGGCVAGRCS